MKKVTRDKILTGLVIVVAVIVLALVFIWFRWQMDNEVTAFTSSYLTKNVEAVSAVFQAKLDDKVTMLEYQAKQFRDVDLSDYNRVKETILSAKGMGGFRSVGIATATGMTINYNGKSAGNISLQSFFQSAMAGKTAISDSTITDEHGDEVIVIAVPVKQNGEVAAVIYGTFTSEEIRNLINLFRFHELGANILLTEDGTILSTNATIQLIGRDVKNLSEVIPNFQIETGTDGQTTFFTVGDREYLLVITYAGMHDWYFGTFLPASAMTEQVSEISGYVVPVIVAILAVFSLLSVFIVRMLRNQEREKKKLDDKASRDSLTQLLNKRAFEQGVDRSITEARGNSVLILCMIDVDDFKNVNDTYGHAVGDAVLIEISERLQRIFRSNDLIGRIGGDEFSVLIRSTVEDCPNREAVLRNRASDVLEDMSRPIAYGGGELTIGVSIGFSFWPESGSTYQSLYENADKALYSAKLGGKNRYEIYQ